VERWPAAGIEVWRELERHPGRIALLTGAQSDDVAERLANLRGFKPLHVGRVLTAETRKPTELQVRSLLRGSPVLVGLEILFDPVLGIDPLRMLVTLARDVPPLAALWPVSTMVGTMRSPGRNQPPHYRPSGLQGSLLLTTRPTLFEDDVPFIVERFR